MDFNLATAAPLKFFLWMMLFITLDCIYQARKENERST